MTWKGGKIVVKEFGVGPRSCLFVCTEERTLQALPNPIFHIRLVMIPLPSCQQKVAAMVRAPRLLALAACLTSVLWRVWDASLACVARVSNYYTVYSSVLYWH